MHRTTPPAMTGNEIYFQVRDRRIHVRSMRQFECRGDCGLELLCDLLENWPEMLEGKSGVVFANDEPPPEHFATEDLNFCTTIHRAMKGPWIPFPDYTFLRWPQVGVQNSELLMNELTSDVRNWESQKVFWIGSDQHPSRRQLWEMGKRHPEVLDIELMDWNRHDPNALVSRSRYVSLPDHRLFKYLVDCPGRGYSGRLKWLLATGRPVFIVERDIVEPWHEQLVPWMHYVPVAADLSDLLESHARLEGDTGLYDRIGRSAREFAAECLTVEARLIETMQCIRNRASAMEHPPAILKADMGAAQIVDCLERFLASERSQLWMIDDRVLAENGQEILRSSFNECDAALLATEVRTLGEDPAWHRWGSLKKNCVTSRDGAVAALLPLVRISRTAAVAVLNGIQDGWTGHAEVLIPTLVNQAGLSIEDIGGTGSFTPPERAGRWYDKRTWHWEGPVEHVPGMLHFPVPRQTRGLAEGRLEDPGSRMEDDGWNMLYVSPVGGSAADLLPGVMEAFQGVGTDRWLLKYDNAELGVPDGVRVIRDKGCKWQLALRHLHPDAMADYDYIFFWDDDLGVSDFDPLRFARIMRANRLDMAQPAIKSPHEVSHAITRHRPCPPPWRHPDGVTAHTVVGRLTNFVEIMAPVFTREAWREFYSYLDGHNRSGWGYDYIPLGRKGIVDALPVVHTRAVQSTGGASEAEIRSFLANQGLFRHLPVEQGWLFEFSRREVCL